MSWLRFDAPAPIRLEQLRFVFSNIPVSFVSGAIANIMLAAVFATSTSWKILALWTVLSWLPVACMLQLGRSFQKLARPLNEVDRYTHYLVITFMVHGIIRGALPWIAFDDASPLLIALLMCYMAAMEAGSMAVVAPVLAAFVCYALPFNVLLGVRLALLDDPVYWSMALGTVFFTVGIISSASKSSATFRRMQELRFENDALVNRLLEESALANMARTDAEAAREEAVEANLSKSRFLAAASHDLRQPIHALGLFLEALARTHPSRLQRNILVNANAACNASGEMLNTLLDFSRLEAGVVAVNRKPFRLLPLLSELEAELAPLADNKGIFYRVRELDVVIHSDPTLVALILRNLISNAIRYTAKGGVLIGCRRRGDIVRLEIWDTGIGIAPHDFTFIFREFHQLHNPERDRRKGLGLGLAIVQRLTKTLQHELSVHSIVGKGSRFSIALPLSTVPAQAAERAVRAEPHTVQPLHLRVMVVDDDEFVRAGMKDLLESWGAQCQTADSADQAHAMAQAADLDLVICDHRLPDARTGIEVIAALRTTHPNLPAILVTGETAPDHLAEAQNGGVPLLHKPVRPDDLYNVIVRVCRSNAQVPAPHKPSDP